MGPVSVLGPVEGLGASVMAFEVVRLVQSMKIQGSNLFLGTLAKTKVRLKTKTTATFMLLLQNELTLDRETLQCFIPF